ncbi:MAG: thiol-disulfide isomerase/thioredoxin [Cyclobacteriaceae bacterium]|jgi:thiol-disulfide isomerase/thioredoxin
MKNLIIVSIFLVGLVSCQPKEETFLSKIKLTDLAGQSISPDQFKDKVVILNLWATWCRPCIQEMPDLVKMQNELSNDFVLLLASDEDREKIQSFTERRAFDLRFFHIQNSKESLAVYSLPTTFIIGQDGQLIETLVGARKWDSSQQIQQLKTYLK